MEAHAGRKGNSKRWYSRTQTEPVNFISHGPFYCLPIFLNGQQITKEEKRPVAHNNELLGHWDQRNVLESNTATLFDPFTLYEKAIVWEKNN